MSRIGFRPTSGGYFFLYLIFCLTISQAVAQSYDVVIYGGTSAGVIAAVQAAKMGKKVVLVSPENHIGGMSVEGLGGTDIDNHKEFQNSPAVGGLTLEFYRRISAHYGRLNQFDSVVATRTKRSYLWRFEPHVAEAVFDQWITEQKVPVLRGYRLKEKGGVLKTGSQIRELRFDNGKKLSGTVFIDATYEGDLLAFAGISFVVGREGNAQYGETKNGIRSRTRHSQLDRLVDPYQRPGQPESGVIFGVSTDPVGEDGAPSNAIQGFSFRLCLTNDPINRLPIEKPAGYDPVHYELQRRYLAAGGQITPPGISLPNRKSDPGSWHPLAGFLAGWNHTWNTASYREREQLLTRSLHYVQGFHWFIQHDPAVPESQRNQWAVWGLCKDEFRDHHGWPRLFYVRNGRRMVSDYVVTEEHGRKETPKPVEDPIGLIWWPHDLHNTRRLVKDGKVWNEGAVFNEQEDWIPFGHAYRSLVPRRSECANLLTPTCPSMSYVAYGAFRLEYSFMVAAQSAATAACLAIDQKKSVQDVRYSQLRERLIKDGQVLSVPNP